MYNQWMDYLYLFFSPTALCNTGMAYRFVCAGPGEIVVVRPGEYYAVVNVISSVAVAVNVGPVIIAEFETIYIYCKYRLYNSIDRITAFVCVGPRAELLESELSDGDEECGLLQEYDEIWGGDGSDIPDNTTTSTNTSDKPPIQTLCPSSSSLLPYNPEDTAMPAESDISDVE